MSRTILVIDDNPAIREVVRRMLESREYVVLMADDGPEGIELMARHEVDAAIVDVEMPLMNGVDVCRVLRERAAAAARSFWVCLMTGVVRPELTAAAAEAGARGILLKPFSLEQLIAYVECQFCAAPVEDRRHAFAAQGYSCD